MTMLKRQFESGESVDETVNALTDTLICIACWNGVVFNVVELNLEFFGCRA